MRCIALMLFAGLLLVGVRDRAPAGDAGEIKPINVENLNTEADEDDPFVGDGISLALRSGAAAAECLVPFLRGDISRAEAEQRYAAAYQHRLLPVFRNSQRLRRLFKLPRPIRRPLAYIFEHTPALNSYLASKTR